MRFIRKLPLCSASRLSAQIIKTLDTLRLYRPIIFNKMPIKHRIMKDDRFFLILNLLFNQPKLIRQDGVGSETTNIHVKAIL